LIERQTDVAIIELQCH